MLDGSLSRRLKRKLSTAASKALEAEDKALTGVKKKILALGAPVISVWSTLNKNDPIKDALGASLQLWGSAFAAVSGIRRSNILRQTDPGYLSLLSDPKVFESAELDLLFGRKFIRWMVQEAEDAALRQSYTYPTGYNTYRRGGRRPPEQYNRAGSKYNRGGFGQTQRTDESQNRYVTDACPVKVAARLLSFASRWLTVTRDPWVLATVNRGLEFDRKPVQTRDAAVFKRSESMRAICDFEVRQLQAKGAVTQVPKMEGDFVCSIFAIPKSSGGFRPVVNLKPLNEFVTFEHFKMETMESFLHLVRRATSWQNWT